MYSIFLALMLELLREKSWIDSLLYQLKSNKARSILTFILQKTTFIL